MFMHITLLLLTLRKPHSSFRQAEIIPREVDGNYSHMSALVLNRMQILTKHVHVLDCSSANVNIFLEYTEYDFQVYFIYFNNLTIPEK